MKKGFYLILLMLPALQSFAGEIVMGLTDDERNVTNIPWGTQFCEMQVSLMRKDDAKITVTNKSVALIVRIKNFSTKGFHIYVHRTITASFGFCFSIQDPYGKDVSPAWDPQSYLTGGTCYVPTNHVNGFQFDLKDICKLDEKGTYKIRIKFKTRIPVIHQPAEVVSNPLSLTVVDK